MLQISENFIKARMDGLFCRLDPATGSTICRKVPLTFIPTYSVGYVRPDKANIPKLDAIIAATCKALSVSVASVRSFNRADNLVIARQVIVWIARTKLELSFDTIGLAISRHHSTICLYFETMKNENRNYKSIISAIQKEIGVHKK
jgi:Bacterial dnaA protein helix-turn-helix